MNFHHHGVSDVVSVLPVGFRIRLCARAKDVLVPAFNESLQSSYRCECVQRSQKSCILPALPEPSLDLGSCANIFPAMDIRPIAIRRTHCFVCVLVENRHTWICSCGIMADINYANDVIPDRFSEWCNRTVVRWDPFVVRVRRPGKPAKDR